MSEIEKAICTTKQAKTYIFTKYIKNGLLDKAIILEKHFDLAIQALQEKAEREKGCEYCKNGVPLVIGKTNDYGIAIQYPQSLNAYGYDIHGTGSNGLICKIEYCPMCGRKLVEE